MFICIYVHTYTDTHTCIIKKWFAFYFLSSCEFFLKKKASGLQVTHLHMLTYAHNYMCTLLHSVWLQLM